MFSKDTRHLVLLMGLLGLGALGYVGMRAIFVPDSWGEVGPFRAEAITEEIARPTKLVGREQCLGCHEKVAASFGESGHAKITCASCHGYGTQHAVACQDVKTGATCFERPQNTAKPPAELIGVDLFIAKHRDTCLTCHEKLVGRAAAFPQIDVKAHLEEQGPPEDASAPAVCFECHTNPHDPKDM
jgi:hypothetical protein